MSDLISREAVKKAIQQYFIAKIENHVYEIDVVDCNAEICHEVIDNIPTAYDVDKVVEQLAKRFDYCHEMAEKNDKAKLEKMAFSWRQVANGVMDAIDIVKGVMNNA